MSFLTLVIYGLAAYRISTLLCHEDGPGQVIKRVRERIDKTVTFQGLLNCVWCVSIWVGGILVCADWLFPEITIRAACVFAFSSVAVIIHRWMEVQYKWLSP